MICIMKKKLLYVILYISLLINLVFFLEEGYHIYNIKRTVNVDTLTYNVLPSLKLFQKKLLEGGVFVLDNRIDRYVPTQYNPITARLMDLLGKKRCWDVETQYEWSEAGYMMQAMFKTAEYHNDTSLINIIKKAFDKHCLNNEMSRVDQSVYATMAIYLYQRYNDIKYKQIADNAYNWLEAHNTEKFGILFVQDDTLHNHVDAVGVYNPFLVEYSKAFNKSEAYTLAVSCFEKFCTYGVEKELGRPVQSFKTTFPYEKGWPNWGRGFSWFSLGFGSIEKDSLSQDTRELVDKFIRYITFIYQRDGRFTQYVNSSKGIIDLSATLPLVYFLYSNHYIDLSEKQILEYSKYMRDNIMCFSSGIPFGWGTENNTSSQRLSQAFMLMIILEYEKRNVIHQ